MSGKGLSRGALDKLARSVERKLASGLKYKDLTKAEQRYHTFYVTGGGCPSGGGVQGLNVASETEKIADPFTVDEQKEIIEGEDYA